MFVLNYGSQINAKRKFNIVFPESVREFQDLQKVQELKNRLCFDHFINVLLLSCYHVVAQIAIAEIIRQAEL